MNTSFERIKRDIENLSMYNQTPELGCTRPSYSKEDRKARDYLLREMKRQGLKITIDGIGNIRGKLEGKNPDFPAIMTGSHIDTVLKGGKYDGIVGVVGGLEVIRTIKENALKLNHPIELVIFSEEEGANFGITTAGSKALVGEYCLGDIKNIKNSKGISYYEILKDFGLDPDTIDDTKLKSSDIKAMIELHIEQSVVLEKKRKSIGIVKGIAGRRAYSIELTGESNHAGATPMNLRKDPMVVAGKIISSINQVVKENGLDTTVATVGKIDCQPNVSNIIAHRVRFTVDIRDVENDAMDHVLNGLKSLVRNVADESKVDYHIECIGESNGILLSEDIVNTIEEVVNENNIFYCKMNSGAVHDAALLAKLVDVGMIFIPSKDGRSHVPEEYTSYEDIQQGCDVLLKTILRLDKM
ncbi:M20 family metallo-hydrolase [Wukongibacter baidiensis]|uniref:M20 family metallo-hydrolase n=1 Tax=Wukongibacter baidiensis TaxID=1723361 RepID=UPI003D7FF184